jgi:hypothetical protein
MPQNTNADLLTKLAIPIANRTVLSDIKLNPSKLKRSISESMAWHINYPVSSSRLYQKFCVGIYVSVLMYHTSDMPVSLRVRLLPNRLSFSESCHQKIQPSFRRQVGALIPCARAKTTYFVKSRCPQNVNKPTKSLKCLNQHVLTYSALLPLNLYVAKKVHLCGKPDSLTSWLGIMVLSRYVVFRPHLASPIVVDANGGINGSKWVL